MFFRLVYHLFRNPHNLIYKKEVLNLAHTGTEKKNKRPI